MSEPTWLGIDLGGTAIKWEHVTDSGSSIAAGRVATPTEGHEAVTDAIAEIIRGAASGTSVPAGVGIAVPGHLTPERDAVTLLPNVAGAWRGYPFVEVLRARTGSSPVLLNDARAFAIAELELGAARGASDVVFVTIGTGIGGAVAIDGRVVRSRRDTTGEVGHIIAVRDGERCTCGHRGCVEAYAGGAQILRRAEREGIEVSSSAGALASLARADLRSLAAVRILREAYDALAVGISSACAFTGAQVVVVGGGVADELPGFLDRSRRRLAERAGLLGEVEVRTSTLGVRAGALGAALAARAEARIGSRMAGSVA